MLFSVEGDSGMSAIASGRNTQYLKWAFFAAMAAATLLVIYVEERFLILPNDPEWNHIAPFKWLLLPHALAGATALITGPLQFSDRIRSSWPNIHRWTGRLYVGAICFVAAPLGRYIGIHYEPRAIHIEQYFQAILWWLTTAAAYVCVRNRAIPMHKIWMMRSYGFCLIFVLSRVPYAFTDMSDQQLADVLWSLVVAALIVPDLVMNTRELSRNAARRREGRRVAA
jgi:hypothetical protein